MLNAYNGTVCFDGAVLDYVRFGSGPKALVVLPGLGDGLRTVKGTAIPMALIPQAKLHMYAQWGHGLYEEAPDFWSVVLGFLQDK